jgi:hypothetical protein
MVGLALAIDGNVGGVVVEAVAPTGIGLPLQGPVCC